jgi:hypothetical protein
LRLSWATRSIEVDDRSMPQANPIMSLFLWAAVIFAVRDWRYLRKGGVRPTRREKQYVAIAIVLCVAVMLLAVVSGGPPQTFGRLTAYFLVVIFAVWELRRVFIRAAHPIRPPKVPQESPSH